jgi:WD40 repeat protein
MMSRSYARLFALALGILLSLALLAACGAGTTGGSAATTTRPQTKVLLTYHGHSDRATAVAWSPDGKDVVSSSLDNTIQVWDASTGAHITTYRSHKLPAQALSWSSDSRSIVSGSSDQTAQVWVATTGKPILTYRGHSAPVNAVMWSPDGKRIASGSVDTTVQIWDATSGKMLLTFRGHKNQVTSLAWSPDGTSIVSGSFDKTVQVWDASTGKVRYIYDGYNVAVARVDNSKGVLPDLILFVAWSHNGQRIAAVTQEYCGDECAVVMTWDAQTGKQMAFYPDLPVYAIAWSPDDTRFASAIGVSDVQIALVP